MNRNFSYDLCFNGTYLSIIQENCLNVSEAIIATKQAYNVKLFITSSYPVIDASKHVENGLDGNHPTDVGMSEHSQHHFQAVTITAQTGKHTQRTSRRSQEQCSLALREIDVTRGQKKTQCIHKNWVYLHARKRRR